MYLTLCKGNVCIRIAYKNDLGVIFKVISKPVPSVHKIVHYPTGSEIHI